MKSKPPSNRPLEMKAVPPWLPEMITSTTELDRTSKQSQLTRAASLQSTRSSSISMEPKTFTSTGSRQPLTKPEQTTPQAEEMVFSRKLSVELATQRAENVLDTKVSIHLHTRGSISHIFSRPLTIYFIHSPSNNHNRMCQESYRLHLQLH